MQIRIVIRVLFLVGLSWGLAKLIELSPPQWKPLASWLPPALITLLVAFAFGRSLFQKEALITRIARIYHGGVLSDELVEYTRRLTALWAYFLLGCAIATALLARFTSFSHLGSVTPLLATCLMLGEYWFRKRQFRHFAHQSPLALMWFMLRHGMPRD